MEFLFPGHRENEWLKTEFLLNLYKYPQDVGKVASSGHDIKATGVDVSCSRSVA